MYILSSKSLIFFFFFDIRILACRNQEKTEIVVEEIKAETGNQNVEFIQLDLMRLDSVTKFAQEFKSRYSQLHILLNNAGVMICPFGLSEDGTEIV